MPNERILENHFTLSPECRTLTRSLCEDDRARVLRLDLQGRGLPRFLPAFAYPVSAWPVLISAEMRERFARILREIPPLLHRAMLRFYESNRTRFSALYRLPAWAYDALAAMDGEGHALVGRYDLVLTGGQPRLLELNVGTRVGGWQVGWLWRQLAEMIARRPESGHWKLWHTSTAEAFCRFVHRATQAHVSRESTGARLVLISPFLMEHGFDAELAAVYDQVVAGAHRPGRLVFETNVETLTENGVGRVEHRGQMVDCVLATSTDLRVPPWACRAHVERRVFYPDNRLHRALGDKTNFAVLHAARSAGWLSEGEAQLVAELIPWSAFLTNDVVEWRGDRLPARDLALARKDELVVKRGVSRQGRDVFVGRFLSDEAWAAAIERAGTDGAWVVQEYCQPDRLYAPNGHAVVTEHDAVWGVFAYGQTYGGAMGRLMEPDAGGGVVNAARGARLCVVLEVA